MAIPLDPGAGGRSIDLGALRNADMIVSTVRGSAISAGIRLSTWSPVSHAMLYIGHGQVVEAIGSGVTLRTLGEAILEATLAVAYRHPELDEMTALQVRDFAGYQLDKPYNYVGIGQQAVNKICILRGNIACAILTRAITIRHDSFFCSELVLAAFRQVGIKLSETEPSWSNPDNIPQIALRGTLDYVGHLRA